MEIKNHYHLSMENNNRELILKTLNKYKEIIEQTNCSELNFECGLYNVRIIGLGFLNYDNIKRIEINFFEELSAWQMSIIGDGYHIFRFFYKNGGMKSN